MVGGGQKWQKFLKYLGSPLLLPLYKGQKCQKCPDDELEEMAEWRCLGGGGGSKVSNVSKVF